jgi:hypothetical protein
MTTGVRLIAAFLLIATLLYPQDKKSKKAKGYEVVVEKIEVRREGDVVLLDGVIKNTGIKTIHGMMLHFQFFAPNREALTIQKGPVESAFLEPGDTTEFRLQVKHPTRAVELTIEAQDRDTRELNVEKNGPYAID